jgi:hypothetical protein
LGLIPALKISDFNLGDRKNYVMLAPHRYLMKMTGKKPKIVPQPWIKELVQIHDLERDEDPPLRPTSGG